MTVATTGSIASTTPADGVAVSSTPGRVGCIRSEVESTPSSARSSTRQVINGQTAKDVVDQTGSDPQVGIVGDAGRLEAHVGVLAHIGRQRDTVLESETHRYGEGVHDAGQGRALLGHLHEHLTRASVLVLADGDVSLAIGNPEGKSGRLAAAGQAFAYSADYNRFGYPGLLMGQRSLQAGDLLVELAGVGLGFRTGRNVVGPVGWHLPSWWSTEAGPPCNCRGRWQRP